MNKSLFLIVLIAYYFLCYFVVENNTEQTFFIIDSIVLLLVILGVLFKIKNSSIVVLLGAIFIFLSPFDLLEGITENKIQYILGYGKQIFNYNRVFPIVIFIGVAFLYMLLYGLYNKNKRSSINTEPTVKKEH